MSILYKHDSMTFVGAAVLLLLVRLPGMYVCVVPLEEWRAAKEWQCCSIWLPGFVAPHVVHEQAAQRSR